MFNKTTTLIVSFAVSIALTAAWDHQGPPREGPHHGGPPRDGHWKSEERHRPDHKERRGEWEHRFGNDTHDNWRNRTEGRPIGGDDHDNWQKWQHLFNCSNFSDNGTFIGGGNHDMWNRTNHTKGHFGGDDHDNWRQNL